MKIKKVDLDDFLNNEAGRLNKIDNFLMKPNYLEILGVGYKELQHSNFLAWMLKFEESHGLGDYFLRNFITHVFEMNDEKSIDLSDLSRTKILREYHNIDLLIVNEELKFTICIENKIWAGKSRQNQLISYFDEVESIWGDKSHNNFYVYLTPFERALTAEEYDKYINVTYESILANLHDTIEHQKPSERVRSYIKDYIDNLEKNIMRSSKENELAKKIYMDNKAVIDFIILNKPTLRDEDLFKKINDYFKESDKYENLTKADKKIIRILPIDLVDHFNLDSWSWKKTKSIFALEIFCETERIWMKFCFGGIGNKNPRKEELQKIKTELFKTMKSFSSLKSGLCKHSRSTSSYPAVATLPIMNINDTSVKECEDYFEAFKMKFEAFENNNLDKWADEVRDKMLIK